MQLWCRPHGGQVRGDCRGERTQNSLDFPSATPAVVEVIECIALLPCLHRNDDCELLLHGAHGRGIAGAQELDTSMVGPRRSGKLLEYT